MSLAYRTLRFHEARGGGKARKIGLTGISCKDCDLETKQERGCHLPGYSFRAELPWRLDYTGQNTDQCWVCPTSVVMLYPEVKLIVSAALEILDAGGLRDQTNQGRGDLDAWYVGAYELVMGARARAQEEAEVVAAQLSAQATRLAVAQQQMRGLLG